MSDIASIAVLGLCCQQDGSCRCRFCRRPRAAFLEHEWGVRRAIVRGHADSFER